MQSAAHPVLAALLTDEPRWGQLIHDYPIYLCPASPNYFGLAGMRLQVAVVRGLVWFTFSIDWGEVGRGEIVREGERVVQ